MAKERWGSWRMLRKVLLLYGRSTSATDGYGSLKNYGLLQRRAAAVAQRIARWTSNSEVVGSSPISGVYKGVAL